ncbi:hypothetical protein GQR36_25200 [Enterococcus termitis]
MASATADLDAKIKSIQESSMTEQELNKQRQAEEAAKTQEYIASLERETRVNYAQSLLPQMDFQQISSLLKFMPLLIKIRSSCRLIPSKTDQRCKTG